MLTTVDIVAIILGILIMFITVILIVIFEPDDIYDMNFHDDYPSVY